MRLLSSLLVFAALASASPVDFGLAEFNAALAARNLKWKNQVELSLDPPETFRVEPYQIGGAHITGGDLRGLMYGLLEAADQIRATGKLTKVTGNPATPLRGIRIVLNGELEHASPEFWIGYFRMLARNRFNRIHVVFEHLSDPYALPAFLSRTAADYGVDFTLGLGQPIDAEELAHLLIICPSIRGVAFEPGVNPDAVFSALRVAGRRVTLDLDGGPAAREMMEAAVTNHVPVLQPASAWPPSFEVAAPIVAADADAHPWFYRLVGQSGYDPKVPVKQGSASEWSTGKEIALWIAVAQQANLGGSDYVASASEAIRNRQAHLTSAKFAPPVIAERLYSAVGQVLQTENEDLKMLAALAREHADQQTAATNLPMSSKGPDPVQWTHLPPASAPSEQPLILVLKMTPSKAVTAVRLHYRPLDPGAVTQAIEVAPAAQVSFTIPARDIPGNWDMTYYFEFVDGNGNGWFEPDPLTATPFWSIHIIAPHTGRN